jgi:hypothetical protein
MIQYRLLSRTNRNSKLYHSSILYSNMITNQLLIITIVFNIIIINRLQVFIKHKPKIITSNSSNFNKYSIIMVIIIEFIVKTMMMEMKSISIRLGMMTMIRNSKMMMRIRSKRISNSNNNNNNKIICN